MNENHDAVRGNNPPYISANIWQAFFDKMQKVNRPSQLSVELLREYGIPTAHSELQSALKFLGLLDNESKTTERFVGIQLKGDAFKTHLHQILKNAYHDLFEKHPLEHASYDDLQNYFSIKYSQASAKKMAKSFAVLCQFAGLRSPAFLKMRTIESAARPSRAGSIEKEHVQMRELSRERPTNKSGESSAKNVQDELMREFIKTNPMPTGVQWDADSLKAFFEQYRETLKMLSGNRDEP